MSVQNKITLLNEKTTTGGGSGYSLKSVSQTFQAWLVGGVGSATVEVQASNDSLAVSDPDNATWETLGTITLDAAYYDSSGGFGNALPWAHVRGNVSAIAGGASVKLVMAEAVP